MALTSPQQNIFNKADRNVIDFFLGNLRGKWAKQRSWLSSRNRYRRNCSDKIKSEKKSDAPTRPLQMGEYIAAAAILHCFDGWSFWGRALQAELTGDPDVARHLGYYAELRAAMSLLASEGIGVFKNCHVVVVDRKKCEFLKGGTTHDFAWEALQYWASLPSSARTVFNAIRPGGLALNEWLNQYSVSTNFVAGEWLEQWGLDLKLFTNDRSARNEVSYQPTFTSPGPATVQDTLDAITQFWKMCEPGIGSPFSVLDRYLLRRSLSLVSKNAFKSMHLATKKKLYKKQISIMLNNMAPGELSAEQWQKFLAYKELESLPRVIRDANGTKEPYQTNHSKQVLSRAMLLLRVATGAAQEHLNKATSNAMSELEFWWSDVSVARALWPTGAPLATLSDLWADVRDAIDNLNTWLQQKPKTSISFHSLWKESAEDAAILCTTERAALWGLGL